MIDLIPPQFRILALLAVIAIASTASAGLSWKVATWKANAECSTTKAELGEKITALTSEISDLKSAIDKANTALLIAKEKSAAIEAEQVQASKLAAEQLAASTKRLDRLKAQYASAQTCGDVLSTYWAERK